MIFSAPHVRSLVRQFTRSSSGLMAGKVSEFSLGKGDPCPPLMPGTLRLYSMRFCPYAQRTRLVIEHKHIPVETINVNLKRKPDWLFEMNPTGLVPVLQWGDKVLYESGACNDYLDEAFPQNKLNPADPYQRARDRQLWESMGKMISSFYDVAGTQGKDEKVLARLFRAFSRYEKELTRRGGPFFGGSQVCMADLMLWPWFERLPVVNAVVPATTITAQKYPKLAEWISKMEQLPAVRATRFDTAAHAHFLTSLRVHNNPDYDHGLEPISKL